MGCCASADMYVLEWKFICWRRYVCAGARVNVVAWMFMWYCGYGYVEWNVDVLVLV